MSDKNKITMSSPDLTDAERQAVQAVLETPNLSMGQYIREFEKAVCELTGCSHAIGVSSGTSALHLCIRAAGIGPGDLVITTPFSFISSTNVILFENAIPVFVDVDPHSGNIDPEMVQQAVRDLMIGNSRAETWRPPKLKYHTGQLKAILPVDVFGQPADMEPIVNAAHKNGLKVIEDSCEALGTKYKGKLAGTLGDYGCFAFYPNKQITTGEGGMIVTDDAKAAEFMQALRNQGRASGDTWLQHTHLGYNYRLDEMSAALGLVQLSRLEEMLQKREKVAAWYAQGLSSIPGIELPVVEPHTTRSSWFVYVVRFEPGINRQEVIKQLSEHNIPARPYFVPIHIQPYIMERFGYREEDFPVTMDLGHRGLALPFSSVMSKQQVEIVYQTLGEILRNLA